MLRPVLLCLAVGLSFVNLEMIVPEFAPIYSATIDYVDILNDRHMNMSIWYDYLHTKSRVDLYGTTQQIVVQAPIRYRDAFMTVVYSFTGADGKNQRVCTTVLCDGLVDFLPVLVYEEEKDFGPLFMELPQRTRMHDQLAHMWQRRLIMTLNMITHEQTWWIAYKELHGKMEAVPLRYESIIRNSNFAQVLSHERFDIYNYDTAKIDPEIFNITKGAVCSPLGRDEVNQHVELLPRIWRKTNLEFDLFTTVHNRQYTNETEHNMRLRIFEENLKMIEEHNRGEHGYTLAVNHLADRTLEEIVELAGGAPSGTPPNRLQSPHSLEEIEKLSAELPKHLDWRDRGAVTPVKDQLQCGASWAFAAVGAVEGALFLHRNKSRIVRLSEQALIDCSWSEGNLGCRGGEVWRAFEWVTLHGIPNTGAYGVYMNLEGTCHNKHVEIETQTVGYVKVQPNEQALKYDLFHKGPIAVKIALTKRFVFYSHGVFMDPFCKSDKDSLTFSALVVGYGVLDGQSYWLVKNSWGPSWGTNGYILMATDDNMCGVLTDANYPIFAP